MIFDTFLPLLVKGPLRMLGQLKKSVNILPPMQIKLAGAYIV